MSDTPTPTPTHTAPPIPTKFSPEDTLDLISDFLVSMCNIGLKLEIDPERTFMEVIRASSEDRVIISLNNIMNRASAYLDQDRES